MHRSAGDWLERVDIVTEVEDETGPESKAYGTLCFGFLGLDLGGRELRWASYFLGGRGWSAWAFRYHRAGDGTSSKHVCGRTGVLGGGSSGGGVVGRLFIFSMPHSWRLLQSAANRRHRYPARPLDAPRQLLKTLQVLCFLPTSPDSPTPSPSFLSFLSFIPANQRKARARESSPPP